MVTGARDVELGLNGGEEQGWKGEGTFCVLGVALS